MAPEPGSSPRLRRWGRGVAALVLLALVGGVVAFRPAVHWIAERELSRALDLRVQIDRLEVSPFRGRLHAEGLAFREKHQGRPLLTVQALDVEIAPTALWRRELLVTRLSLERPEAWAALTPEGLSWLPAAGTSGGSRLAVSLGEAEVRDGRLHLTDPRHSPERQEELGDLAIRLRNLSTREDRREERVGLVLQGRWRGMRVSAEGWLTPFAARRAFHLPLQISRADLAQVAAVLPAGIMPEGLAGSADVGLELGGAESGDGWQADFGVQAAATDLAATPGKDLRVAAKSLRLQGRGRWTPKVVEFSKLDLDVAGGRIDLPSGLQASVDRISLGGKADLDHRGLLVPEMRVEMAALDLGPAGSPPRIHVGRLAATGGTDQRAGTARLEQVSLAGVSVRMTRETDGSLDLVKWMPQGPGETGGSAFTWEVLQLEVERAGLEVADRKGDPGPPLVLRDGSLRLGGASSDPAQPVTFEVRGLTSVAPSFDLHGTWLRSPWRLQVEGALQDVDLPTLSAWLPGSLPVGVSAGQASLAIQADLQSSQENLAASGSAKGKLRGLRLAGGREETFSVEDLEMEVARFRGAGPGLRELTGEAQGRIQAGKVRARPGGPEGSPGVEASADLVQVDLGQVRFGPGQAGALEVSAQGRAAIRGLLARAESQGVKSFTAREVLADVGGLNLQGDPGGARLSMTGRVSVLQAEGSTPRLPLRTWKATALQADIAQFRTSPFGLRVRELTVGQPEAEIVRAGGETPAAANGTGGDAFPPVQVDRLAVRDGRLGFRDETVRPPWTADLRRLEGEVEDLRVDTDEPARVRLSGAEAGGTQIRLAGNLRPTSASGQVRLEVENLDLLRGRPYLPDLFLRVVRGGTASGALDLTLRRNGQTLQATGAGEVTLAPLEIGDASRQISFLLVDKADVRLDQFSLDPLQVNVGTVRLERPWVAVAREKDGSLPALRLLNELRRAGEGAPAAGGATSAISVGRLQVQDGVAEIEDQGVQPAFREQVQDLALTVEGLTTQGDRKAGVTLRGKLGDRSGVNLHGFVLPLASNLYVDLEGEISDFNLPRLNTYAARVTSYRLEQGKLDSRVRYHVEENRLEGDNLFRIDQLALGEQVTPEDRFEALVGVPLAMAISLLQDASGEIILRVPVHGDLTHPEFDLGDAIASAIKHAVINLITAPFQLLGQIFTLGGRIGAIEIAPVLFAPGSWLLDEAAQAHLKTLAVVLRDHPKMKLKLSGASAVESDEDGLRARKVEQQLQLLSREPGVKNREDAVDALYLRTFGASAGSLTRGQKLAKLKANQKILPRDVEDLPDARVLSVYDFLAGAGGIERDRLFLAEGKLYRAAEGGGDWARRVDFSILHP